MIRIMRLAAKAATLAATLPFAASTAVADWSALNMPRGVTPSSHDVYGLHMTIFWITVVIGVLVFGAMFIAILRHRKSRGVKAAQFHHSTAVEIVWTVIPLFILIGMAIPATRVVIDMERTDDAEMTIVVTGYQWLWGYEYVEDDIHFFSRLDSESDRARQLGSGIDPASVDNYLLNVDKPLVLPTDTKIRFQITAQDVIHSWWVPELGWKKDAIPGFVNETWTEIMEPGVYRGQCAELCGRDHGFMPIVVVAKTPDDYREWVAEQQDASAEDADEADGGDTASARDETAAAALAAR